MTNTEAYIELNSMTGKYKFSGKEKEAIYHAAYLVKKKAEEEKVKAMCMYYVGDYKFHEFKDALKMARTTPNLRNSFILEKRLDANGNGKTKKYTLSNGEILGVHLL